MLSKHPALVQGSIALSLTAGWFSPRLSSYTGNLLSGETRGVGPLGLCQAEQVGARPPFGDTRLPTSFGGPLLVRSPGSLGYGEVNQRGVS